MYGVYQTPAPQQAELTYAWKEGGQVKMHAAKIAAGAKEHKLQVPTGAAIADEYIRIRVP